MTTGAAIAGKYQLLRPLGKGSMGEVWAAMHLDLGREVALKLIYEGSPELATRLKREAQACGRLEHPNIVRVYDYGETDGGDPFLVMELLVGETLADRLEEQKRLPVVEALSITIDVARALRAAHEAGVVHRDLKPANVFLCQSAHGETVKVLDFGVSKILSVDDMSVTTTGALVGSPAYMSPEQARALREIDPRADLWSVGVLLFEMLTGTRPFPSPTVVGVVADILAGPIPTLSSVMPGVDPRIELAVKRCLTRELDRRMPSAAALVDMLQPVLALASATPQAAYGAASNTADVRLDPNDPDEASTIALPGRPTQSDEPPDSDKETEVLRGRAGLAMVAMARAARAQKQEAPPPPPPQPSRPQAAPPRPPAHSDDDMPTRVNRSDDGQETTVPTRLIANPFAARSQQHIPPPAPSQPVGHDGGRPPMPPGHDGRLPMPPGHDAGRPPMPPVPMPPGPASYPMAAPMPMQAPIPTSWNAMPPPRPASHTWPTQPAPEHDNSRLTLPPGWGSAQSDARRVLWITAIAGLVVGLVVFVGLSLLR